MAIFTCHRFSAAEIERRASEILVFHFEYPNRQDTVKTTTSTRLIDILKVQRMSKNTIQLSKLEFESLDVQYKEQVHGKRVGDISWL